MKVGELGERALVKLIAELIECTAVLCPGADDCSAIAYGDRYLVVTTDMLHKKTHFPREMSGYQVGWMATAATLSDVAAMGAAPIGVTMAIGIPRDTEVAFALDVMRGCNAVSYTHLRAHETRHDLVCRLLLEKKKNDH